jgi:arsenical pump membrane protein
LTFGHAHAAFSQAWPAFALVAGLLLIGAAAAREGLFAATGAFVSRAPGGALALLTGLLLAEACVTAILNLDTAVVFMTPVLLQAARHRGIGDGPFLYGAVFMANAASLFLPGSNLTNLIVLAHDHVSGTTFAARLAAPGAVSVALTIAFVAVVFRRTLARESDGTTLERPRLRPRAGVVGVAIATVLVLALAQPALPVLALGVVVAIAARLGVGDARRAANPVLLLGVLAAAVLLGTVARAVDVGRLVDDAGRWQTAGIAALASVLVNNLPAAVMLSARIPAHPRALLFGLDLGPNLAVTGSLSAILWLQVARANGARPSIRRYSVMGVVLVPLTIAAALLVSRV